MSLPEQILEGAREHLDHHEALHTRYNNPGHAADHATFGADPVIDGFEWEKWTPPGQELADASGAPDWGGTTVITNWESTPNIGSVGGLEDCFDPATGVFTPADSGWYVISWQLQFAANANGLRRGECSIVHAVQQVPSVGGSNATRISSSGLTFMDGPGNEHGRYFTATVTGKQTSGGPLYVTYAALHIVRLGPGT